MAEPARQLDDEPEQPIYDESGTAPSNPKPGLKALEGGGETTEPKRGHLSEAGAKQPSRDELSSAEKDANTSSSQHENQVGRGYTPGSHNQPLWRRYLQNRKRAWLMGGGITAILAGASIALFLALLPLKILHIVDNLQSHFFATGENAVTKETDTMLSSYVQKYVMPGLRKCGGSGTIRSTIDKSCNPIPISGTSPVSSLFNAWKTARFENTLAEQYGTEFQYNTNSGRYYVKSPYLSKEVDVTDFAEGKVGLLSNSTGWTEVSGKEFADFLSNLHNQIDDITQFKKVMYRFKLTGILNKYGATRCIISCDARRTFKDAVANKKKAAQIKFAQRVIEPQSQQLGLIIQCILAGSSCNVQPDDQHPGLNGEPRSPAEVQLQESLAELASQEGGQATLDSVAQAVKGINEQGWTRYAMGELFASIVEKACTTPDGCIGAQQTARQLGQDALGPVGWVLLASQILSGLNHAGPIVKELGYAMNSAAYAKTYLTYRTYADEIKTGNVDSTMVGSFTDSLGPGSHCFDDSSLDAKNTCSNGETQLGGTADATQTPLYQSLFNGQSDSQQKNYLCKDGNPPPSGQLVCPEEELDKGNQALDSLHNFLNLPVIGQLSSLADITNNAVFILMEPFGWLAKAFGLIPGVSFVIDKVTGLASSVVSPLFKDLVGYLIDIPVSTNMSGGRTFDAMAGGADVVGNDFAHHELGGVELTNQQVAYIRDSQAQESLKQYQSQSLIARLLNTNSQYSPIAKLALAMPNGVSDISTSMASFLGNPFSHLSSMLGSIFSHVQAASATSDPFGITQYGYPTDDPIFKTDPENYWQDHCSDTHYNDAWNKSSLSNVNQDTYQPENPQQPVDGLADSDIKGTDPCLLIQATVGSDGALFNPGLLTADDTSQ